MSPASFPLILLSPVSDAHYIWSALLLEMEGRFDASALIRLLGEFGLDEVLGQVPCIISLPDPVDLPNEALHELPAEKIILRLPAKFCGQGAAETERLMKAGFRIMVDGLPTSGLMAGITSLALPCPAEPSPGVAAILARLPGPHLGLGTDSVSHYTHGAGLTWFCGNYLPRFEKGKGPVSPHHQFLLLRLLALVAADSELNELEAIVKQDAQISYQLLKLVNSVAFSLPNKITSFKQAITILGRRQLQRWLQLLLYAHAKTAAPNPLMPRAALRAELMESLCVGTDGNRESQDRAYMVGMFSLLDRLLGCPMPEVIAPLGLADEVVAALIARQGPMGAWLSVIETSEKGSPALPVLSEALSSAGIEPLIWAKAQVIAYRWAIPIGQEE